MYDRVSAYGAYAAGIGRPGDGILRCVGGVRRNREKIHTILAAFEAHIERRASPVGRVGEDMRGLSEILECAGTAVRWGTRESAVVRRHRRGGLRREHFL